MKSVRVCPKCGSTDTSYDLSLGAIATKFTLQNFVCNKCGHSGPVFPEMDEKDVKEFKKQLRK